MNNRGIQEITDNYPELRNKMFARGFLFTDAAIDTTKFPFYGNWICSSVSNYNLIIHPDQTFYIYEKNGLHIALVGHAYNPFTGEWDEKKMLEIMTEAVASDEDKFIEYLNQLTGVFTIFWIKDNELHIVGDVTCMQNTFYTKQINCVYISSHTCLLGGLLGLNKDPFVEELSHYRFFKLLGNSLPGDITQYKEVKRVVPNHILTFKQGCFTNKRFYWPHRIDVTIEEIVDHVSKLMAENMRLITKKWNRPAISLTGGVDSKTTLACANGLYDKYKFFSYESSDEENVDAEAAKKICDYLGLEHKIYHITRNDADYENTSLVAEILNWNTGDIRKSNANDVRKRIALSEIDDFDVEVKSWSSEIGRAYYSKRFNGRTNYGKSPTPRKCTTLYKFFLHNRQLVKKVDRVFEEYIKNFFEQDANNPVEWQEQFFWEFRFPSWNGLVITGEQRYSNEITIPYNNRKIIELLLNVDIQDRINDTVYKLIREGMNPTIEKANITVNNVKHTARRAIIENIYYKINTLFHRK